MQMASERKALAEHCRQATRDAVEALGGRGSRAAIRERALRAGGFTPAELAVPGPPSRPQGTYVDYYLSLSLTWLKKDGILVNEARGMWALAGTAPAEPARKPEPTERQREYRAYLRSPEWQVRREEALRHAGHRCQLDASHAGPLHVHHNSYERLGHELAEDLLVLCEGCHRRHHGHELAARRRDRPAPPEPQIPTLPEGPLLVDVAARHEELMRRNRRRWPWSKAA